MNWSRLNFMKNYKNQCESTSEPLFPSPTFELLNIFPLEGGKGNIHVGIDNHNGSCFGVIGCGPRCDIKGMIWFILDYDAAHNIGYKISKGNPFTMNGNWNYGNSWRKPVQYEFDETDMVVLGKAINILNDKMKTKSGIWDILDILCN